MDGEYQYTNIEREYLSVCYGLKVSIYMLTEDTF